MQAHFRVEELVEHAAFVRALARALTRDEHAADDVCQETWRAALLRPPQGGRDALPWLASVVRRVVSRRRRDETRRGDREMRAARMEALPASASIVEREESLRTIVEAVLALAEPYRSTVLLRFYENRPPREIATRMDVAVDTVHTRIRRALSMLRERLADQRLDRGALLALAAPRLGEGSLGSIGSSVEIAMKAKAFVVVCGLAVIGAGVGTMLWLDANRDSPRAEGARASPTLADGGAVPDASGEAASRSDVAVSVAEPPAVSGRVIDTSGNPVANALIFVGAETDPFGRACEAPRLVYGAWIGRTFETDSAGRYGASPAESRSVAVALGLTHTDRTIWYEPASEDDRERVVHTPAYDVDFIVRRVPTAIVAVRAERAGTRAPLEGFVALIANRTSPPDVLPAEYQGYFPRRADGAVARVTIPVRSTDGDRYAVQLIEPKTDEPVEAEVLLTPDAEIEVVLVVPSEGTISGYVVDESGRGIEGAHVFFGDATAARGDEPFKPFDAERLPSSATSGPDGWFEVEGDGPIVTAWHADFSEATVARSSASRIVLRARATVSGRLFDERGEPVRDRMLVFGARKGGVEARTDAHGRFHFERVEAGAHGVWLDGSLVAGVRVEAGEEIDVDIALPRGHGRFELVLVRDGAPVDPQHVDGLLVGVGRVFGLFGLENGEVDARVPPGRYFLATREGAALEVELDGERATLELGDTRLVVRAEPGRKVSAVPAYLDRFTRLIAARQPILVPGSGELSFDVHPGRYALVGHAGELITEVDVGEDGAAVDLR